MKNQLSNAKNKVQGVSEKENAGNNRTLLTKIEDFCSEVPSWILAFLLEGFWGFANFSLGLRVLVPPKASLLIISRNFQYWPKFVVSYKNMCILQKSLQ